MDSGLPLIQYDLILRVLITSAKTLFINKVTFIGTRLVISSATKCVALLGSWALYDDSSHNFPTSVDQALALSPQGH